MEHLALEVFDLTGTGSQYATLPEDSSITITDTSELFASGNVWSHPFKLNVRANAHIFGTAGDMHGSRLHEQINKRKARLWVEGIPLYLGYLILGNDAEVNEEGDVDVSFESGQKTFEEMIEGAKANQVPMKDDVLIGMALWRKRWNTFYLQLTASAKFSNGRTSEHVEVSNSSGSKHILFVKDSEKDEDSIQQYPRMVFPKGKFFNIQTGGSTIEMDCINTDIPYDGTHPYCNIALCYQKTGYEKKEEKGTTYNDYSAEPESMRGYEVMPANRVNSAPNFYVIYWIEALMKHLGIYIEENQMMDVEDLRRLFFVNTNCDYIEPTKFRYTYDERFGKFQSVLSGRLIPELVELQKNINLEESELPCSEFQPGTPYIAEVIQDQVDKTLVEQALAELTIEKVTTSIKEAEEFDDSDKRVYEAQNSLFHYAFASSNCFPNVDISEVIEAIENGFGVRFLFTDNYQRVRIILLRNVFQSMDVQDIKCDIISESKVENATRGFRMTYGESSDTSYYYKGFADKLPHQKPYFADDSDKHDYSHWNLDASYASLIHSVSAFDKTCYVTKNTGNAFGIKVDKNAKRYDDLHPSLFEYAGFMDAEDGDCTGDEDTIETITVGFKPAIMNDVNYELERNDSSNGQRFALFVDEAMRPRRPNLEDLPNKEQPDVKSYDDADAIYDVDKLYEKFGPGSDNNMSADNVVKPGEFAIRSDMAASQSGLKATLSGLIIVEHGDVFHTDTRGYKYNWPVTFSISGHVNEGYRLYLQDNYEPNDDGVSPVEKHDWGLTLGIMRGSGTDASVYYEPDPDDKEGNDTWEIRAGSSVTMHPDTCDSYGNEWDYGDDSNTEGRFSLKLRAEKPNPYFDSTKEESDDNRRYLEITNENLQGRGLSDQFYKAYSYWVRNARIADRTVRMSLAQLLTIDKTKKATVGDITGFIRKLQISVNNKTGLGMVKMEIMYI